RDRARCHVPQQLQQVQRPATVAPPRRGSRDRAVAAAPAGTLRARGRAMQLPAMRALAMSALAACHAQPGPGTSPRQVASVPFEDDFGLIFVQVSVGDAPPRWFLLDSGADQTILDRGVAAELGLKLDGAGKEAEPGGEIAIEHARDVTFRVGGAPF